MNFCKCEYLPGTDKFVKFTYIIINKFNSKSIFLFEIYQPPNHPDITIIWLVPILTNEH